MDRTSILFNAVWDKKNIKLTYVCTAIIIAVIAVLTLLVGVRSISVQASTTKVGMIFDSPSIEDMSFKWISYQGLLRAESQLGVVGTIYTSTNPSDFELNTHQCALDGNSLCIGVGYQLLDAISNTAEAFPDTYFALLDATYENYRANLRGISFASEEVGYLAGTLAGLMSHTDVIGDLGGMEIPTVIAFTEAYSIGAHCANPEVTTIISYAGDFGDPELGAEYAQGMISQGADVIFAVAGLTGNGAILTATQSGKWAIGVDTDQYYSVFLSGTITGSNYLLTSAMKRLDNAVYYSISDIVSGTFISGTIIYNLADSGVGLAPFHEAEEAIPSNVRTMIDWTAMAIIDGRISPLDPYGACLMANKQFLPITLR